jgi:hypothetical protein
MTLYTELLNETRERISDIPHYPGIAHTSMNAIDAAYTFFRTIHPESVDYGRTIDQKKYVLQQMGVRSINGAAMVFGSFEDESDFEALPWLTPSKARGVFAYHDYVINDLFDSVTIDSMTSERPDMVRSFMVDASQTRPIFLMHEFDTLPLQHKKAISKVATRTHPIQFSLLERSKGVNRVTDFKPH